MSPGALIGFCIAASLFAPQVSLGQGRSYVSTKFQYRLSLPPRWNTSDNGSGVLTIFDYKPSEAGPQGLFLDSGAEILVIPFAGVEATTKAKTLDEWIAHSRSRADRGVSTQRRPDLSKGGNSQDWVVEVNADFERDSQDGLLQHEVDYYFTLTGRMLRLMLIYWKGNPQASQLRSVCEAVLRSVQAR